MKISKYFRIKNKSTLYINRELDQLFNAIADGILVINKDFTIIRVNKAFLRLTGLSKRKVLRANAESIYETFTVSNLHRGNHNRQILNMRYQNA